jgi:hypothetical protein
MVYTPIFFVSLHNSSSSNSLDSNSNSNNHNHNNTSTMTAASKIDVTTRATDKTTTNMNTNIHTNTLIFSSMTKNNGSTTYLRHKTVPTNHDDDDHLKELMGQPLQKAAGPLRDSDIVDDEDHEDKGPLHFPKSCCVQAKEASIVVVAKLS